MEEKIPLGDKLVMWDNFCKLVERISVNVIDPIATSNMKLTMIKIEKVGQVYCRHVNNIIHMVVVTYILGPSFTKIKDRMRSHDENITKEKKGGTKKKLNLSHAPLNKIGPVVIKCYHWTQTTH
jgi:hypothetical protein